MKYRVWIEKDQDGIVLAEAPAFPGKNLILKMTGKRKPYVMRQVENPSRRVVVPDHKDTAKGILRNDYYAFFAHSMFQSMPHSVSFH